MLRRYVRPEIIFIVLLTLAVMLWLIHSSAHQKLPETTGGGVSSLEVSTDGQQTTSSVDGAALQQAAPPASSTTTAGLTPQQALPYTAQ